MKTLSRSFLNQGTKCSYSRTANEVKKHGDYSEVSCSRDGVEYLLNHKGDPLLGFPSEVSGDRAIVLSGMSDTVQLSLTVGFPIDTSKFSDGGARYAPHTLRKYLNEYALGRCIILKCRLSEDNQRPIRNKINDIFLHSGGFVDFGMHHWRVRFVLIIRGYPVSSAKTRLGFICSTTFAEWVVLSNYFRNNLPLLQDPERQEGRQIAVHWRRSLCVLSNSTRSSVCNSYFLWAYL